MVSLYGIFPYEEECVIGRHSESTSRSLRFVRMITSCGSRFVRMPISHGSRSGRISTSQDLVWVSLLLVEFEP
ncbi:hypothetical protein KY290_001176 [Solanum tuberosum]|uniref:Uncharacterized protein n=1 Tax=Solanum tuberosum TaxID=4113 RepID=A0ABQ7WLI4_SOLTU|nr:hypothetical protein KY290_001176 [Solanum tuberosum]